MSSIVYQITADRQALKEAFSNREQWELYSTMKGWQDVADGINASCIRALSALSGTTIRMNEGFEEADDSDQIDQIVESIAAVMIELLSTTKRRQFGAADTEGCNNMFRVIEKLYRDRHLKVKAIETVT